MMSEELVRVRGIGPIAADRLHQAGIRSIEEIANSKTEELAWIKGIGKISADKIIENAKEILKLEKGIENVLNSIKKNFIESCPKCGGSMKERLIVLGPEKRLRANQCSICKFYLPK
ncbi:MAG: helix-hairpin-helix domain-containing protein [Candidatus Lokiarchaeota archaeon]|nr:helix-hairpin-helix domain-containing protein [Candidatus Lokiarchaeota archaeon]